METVAYILAAAVLYVWFASYVTHGFTPKCGVCGGNLIQNKYTFPTCEDCGDTSLWYNERKLFTAVLWPVFVPLTYVWRAGAKANKNKD